MDKRLIITIEATVDETVTNYNELVLAQKGKPKVYTQVLWLANKVGIQDEDGKKTTIKKDKIRSKF